MTNLTLKACDEVREQMPKFEQILTGYGIRIVERWENEQAGSIELSISAYAPTFIRSVRAAAYDCFGDTLLSFNLK